MFSEEKGRLGIKTASLKISSVFKFTYYCFMLKDQYTVKPVNKGHPRERQHMAFIDKWSLFGCYFVLFYQGRVIEVAFVYRVAFIWRWPSI